MPLQVAKQTTFVKTRKEYCQYVMTTLPKKVSCAGAAKKKHLGVPQYENNRCRKNQERLF